MRLSNERLQFLGGVRVLVAAAAVGLIWGGVALPGTAHATQEPPICDTNAQADCPVHGFRDGADKSPVTGRIRSSCAMLDTYCRDGYLQADMFHSYDYETLC